MEDKILEWKHHPEVMVRELFGVTPDLWQDEVLKAFPHKKRIAMKASKGVGKSAVEAWLAWNFLLTRTDPYIAATSITGANLSDGLWTEMARWQKKSPLLTENFTWTKTTISFNKSPATWFMSACPWSKSADKEEQGKTLAGKHADNIMFILDESGGIPEAVAAAAEAALSSCRDGHIIQAGNPTETTGMLYKACTRDKALWHVIEITSDPDSPMRSQRVSVEWARSQIQMYGRDNPWVQVNVFGQFPSSSFNSLLGIEDVEEAVRRRWREPDYSRQAKILGVDVARYGEDSSVLFLRQGVQAFNPWQYRNLDSVQGADRVARKAQELDVDAIFIDNSGGFGSGWIDNLINTNGLAPVGVSFSEKAANPRYYNKRSEMMFEAAAWIKRGGSIPDIPELKAALTETTYSHKGDALIIEPKEMIKARLGYSPDHCDAFILTFAQPVVRAASNPNVGSFRSNYNPLDRNYVTKYLNERR